MEWSNGILRPSQDSFTYIEAVSSVTFEEIGVPGENHRPSESEPTNFLTLGSVPSGIQT